MARKIFKRSGLRRDKNFGDLLDPVVSLNNLLGAVVTGEGLTFISEDLNCIRNIFSEGIEPEGYQQFIGSSVKRTTLNGTTVPVEPSITYQNRLDYYETNSGEPRLNGGNGLTAKYFNSDQVDSSNPNIFVGVSTLGTIPNDNFWEDGNFEWIGKFNSQSAGPGGGIEWEGYYVPTETATMKFHCDSSISFTMEFEKEGYTAGDPDIYVNHANVNTGITTVGIGSTSGSAVGNLNDNEGTLVLDVEDTKRVGVGMTVTGIGISDGSNGEHVLVSVVDKLRNIIRLENPDGSSPVLEDSVGIGYTVTFARNAGDVVDTNFYTHILEAYRPYRIRFRTYIDPSINPFGVEKVTEFNITRPSNTQGGKGDIRFTDLYDINYDFSDAAKGFINVFDDNSILAGGGDIGSTTDSNEYVKVKTSKKVDVTYSPKTSHTAIIRREVNGTWTANTNIIIISDTSNIEVGNYIFGSGLTANINTPLRVKEIAINNYIVTETNANSSASSTQLTVVDHRGFVKRVTGGGTNNITFTAGDTTDLESNMVAIWNGKSDAYVGITTNGNSTEIAISTTQTVGAGTTMYFYQSKGLVDKSLNYYCNVTNQAGRQVECIKVTQSAAAGSNQLTVEDTKNIGNQWKIFGAPFASGTFITTPPNTTTIPLDTPTIAGIASGAVFTAIQNNIQDDRSICCPPTDTSPPFNPTLSGLETPSGQKDLKLDGGNIKIGALIIVGAATSTVATSDKSDATVDIDCGGTTFKILAKS